MSPVLVTLVAAVTVWVLFSWSKAARSTKKPDIPLVDVDGEKSAKRYMVETGRLIARGYAEYSKKGLAFCIPNLSDPSSPLVVLPLKYLDEVALAPQSKLSLYEYFSKLGLLQYTFGPPVTDEVQRAARTSLNRALNDLTEPFQQVCLAGIKKHIPPCQGWTPLRPYNNLMNIFVCISSRMLVGPDLLDQWIALSTQYIPVFMMATQSVRVKYPHYMRWLAKYVDADVKGLIKTRRQGAEMLRPELQARLAEFESDGKNKGDKSHRKHGDAIQWLVEEHRAKGHTVTPDELVQGLFTLTVSSTHQTSMIALWVLFELINHPDSMAEIREEIARVHGRLKNGVLTRLALGELRIMDSFMTETMRIHSSAQTTMNRMVMHPWTFKDGFELPVGTQISFPTEPYSLDPEVYAQPLVFDAKRHLRKRESGDPTLYHMASTADTLVWGKGPYACPGRFMVQDSLKLMFVHLLARYDFKYPEDGDKLRPSPDVPRGIMTGPDVTMPILFKERSL